MLHELWRQKSEQEIQRICPFDRLAKWLFASEDWAKFYRKLTNVSVKHSDSRRPYFNYYFASHSCNDGLNEQVKEISSYAIDTGSNSFLACSQDLSTWYSVDKLRKHQPLIVLTCPFCKYPDIPAAAAASAAASTACRCSSWGAPLSSLSLGPSLLLPRSLLAEAAAAVLP